MGLRPLIISSHFFNKKSTSRVKEKQHIFTMDNIYHQHIQQYIFYSFDYNIWALHKNHKTYQVLHHFLCYWFLLYDLSVLLCLFSHGCLPFLDGVCLKIQVLLCCLSAVKLHVLLLKLNTRFKLSYSCLISS